MSINLLSSQAFSSAHKATGGNDVHGALRAASRATGVDFAYLAANAALESGLDPSAKAKTSSAAGLFQFIESTWADMVERHGAKVGLAKEAAALSSGDVSKAERQRIMDMRYDAGVAARLGAEFAAENARYLDSKLDRPVEDVDLYLAHFLGPAGAANFLDLHDGDPTRAAAQDFPAAAKANRAVFYDGAGHARSYEDIRDRFQAKLDREGAPDAIATALADGRPAGRDTAETAGARSRLRPIAAAAVDATPVRAQGTTQASGDPWLSTLVSAQLTMNDSLGRVRRDGDAADRAYRSLLN